MSEEKELVDRFLGGNALSRGSSDGLVEGDVRRADAHPEIVALAMDPESEIQARTEAG